MRSTPIGLTRPQKSEPRFVRVSGGTAHTCAVTSDGGVVCWGDRLLGQRTGAGMQRRAVRIGGIHDVVALNSAALGTCALRRSGEVMCWGERGANARRVPTLAQASSLAAAGFLACALQDGVVWCWDMAPFESGSDPPEPKAVRRLARETDEICKGEGYMCSREGGRASCWKDDPGSQAGEVVGVSEATMLECGDELACVIHSDATVSCWGGSPGSPGWWTAHKVPGATDIVELAVGDRHACGLQASGAVLCWGSNEDGQLGSYRRGSDQAGWVPELPRATAIGAGARHTCAAQADGSISCWGANDNGQLGWGDIPGAVRPEKIAELSKVEGLIAAGSYTCAVKQGEASCWGLMKSFEPAGIEQELATPTVIPQFRGAVGTSAGSRGQCAWTADATLRCSAGLSAYIRGERAGVAQMMLVDPLASSWMLSSEGTLQNLSRTTTIDAAKLRPETAKRAAPGARIEEVAEVEWFTQGLCVRHRDGAVRCVDKPGQEPLAISTLSLSGGRGSKRAKAPLGGVVSLKSSENQVCGLLGDGTVACADGYSEGTAEIVPELRQIVELSAGEAHFCARTRGGEVLCWGANRSGQLGDGTTEGRGVPAPVPGLKDVKALASGAVHTCALTKDRDVLCWGRHYGNGQMTRAIAIARSMVPRVVQGYAELGAPGAAVKP